MKIKGSIQPTVFIESSWSLYVQPLHYPIKTTDGFIGEILENVISEIYIIEYLGNWIVY